MNQPKKIAINLVVIAAIVVIAVLLIGFFSYENNHVVVTDFELKTTKLPLQFNNYKILQISDLHGKEFGSNQKTLLRLIRKCRPNVIVITGDLVDRDRYDDVASMKLVDQVVKIAPVYYVTGNHEWQSGMFLDRLEPKLVEAGVVILRDGNAKIKRGDEEIVIAGIDDISRYGWITDSDVKINDSLARAMNGTTENEFRILLAHRPEIISAYEKAGADLVFSGHTHGGQIRIPLIGAIFAPDQGFFPEYASGRYMMGKTMLIVSRGLGDSIIPLRLFCDPEIVLLTLKK